MSEWPRVFARHQYATINGARAAVRGSDFPFLGLPAEVRTQIYHRLSSSRHAKMKVSLVASGYSRLAESNESTDRVEIGPQRRTIQSSTIGLEYLGTSFTRHPSGPIAKSWLRQTASSITKVTLIRLQQPRYHVTSYLLMIYTQYQTYIVI